MNFQNDVLQRSHEIPVVVDFWAEWCGPCRVLGPVLDRLATEQAGRWELVKINTEEHPDLAQQYRVMSIPNVKLFHQGEVIDEFAGALPKATVERWLDKALPDPDAGELDTILAKYTDWPEAEAVTPLESFLQNHPQNRQAALALARHLSAETPERIPEALKDIHLGEEGSDEATDLLTLHEWLTAKLPDSPAGQHLQQAREAFRQGEKGAALKQVVDAVMADKTEHKELPRRLAIAFFHLLGDSHELTRKYRRLFDMALY